MIGEILMAKKPNEAGDSGGFVDTDDTSYEKIAA
jgi:hypothetical protein